MCIIGIRRERERSAGAAINTGRRPTLEVEDVVDIWRYELLLGGILLILVF